MNLVTGGTGHIGNVLVKELLNKGEKVRVLLLPGEDLSPLEGLDVEIYEGNVLDQKSILPALIGIENVFHLAGIISIKSGEDPFVRDVNVNGTRNMVKASRSAGVKRFIYTSSIHAFKRMPYGVIIDEKVPIDPNASVAAYDRSKAEATLAVLAEVQLGLPAVIVCPTGVIGPYDYKGSELGVQINDWMMHKVDFMIDGTYDFVDVRDVVQGIISARDHGSIGQIYILSGQLVRVVEIWRMVKELVNIKASFIQIPTKLAFFAAKFSKFYYNLMKSKPRFTTYSLETLHTNAVINNIKARTALGYHPRSAFETIRDTVTWWQEKETPFTKKVTFQSMNGSWNGKLALITGASSGIGMAIANRLSSQGIRVILVARNLENLISVSDQIKSTGNQAYCYSCDLTKSEDRITLFDHVTHDLGIPDILINNAGVGWYGYFYQMPWKIAENLLFLNIMASTHLTSLFMPEMLKLGKGRIINIGSIVGKLPEQGVALYSASKGYLDSFTKSIFRELKGTKLLISIVRAGPVKTNFFNNAANSMNGRRIPAESLAVTPELIANKVWALIKHPRRYVYVPFYTFFSPLLEVLFSWALDLVGPILLRLSPSKE